MSTRIFRRLGKGPHLISVQLSLTKEKARTTAIALDMLKSYAATASIPQATFSWIVAEAVIKAANEVQRERQSHIRDSEPFILEEGQP